MQLNNNFLTKNKLMQPKCECGQLIEMEIKVKEKMFSFNK